MIEFIGWVGAATMVGASFNMGKPLGLKMAIVGLSLLTVQARQRGLRFHPMPTADQHRYRFVVADQSEDRRYE